MDGSGRGDERQEGVEEQGDGKDEEIGYLGEE